MESIQKKGWEKEFTEVEKYRRIYLVVLSKAEKLEDALNAARKSTTAVSVAGTEVENNRRLLMLLSECEM